MILDASHHSTSSYEGRPKSLRSSICALGTVMAGGGGVIGLSERVI